MFDTVNKYWYVYAYHVFIVPFGFVFVSFVTIWCYPFVSDAMVRCICIYEKINWVHLIFLLVPLPFISSLSTVAAGRHRSLNGRVTLAPLHVSMRQRSWHRLKGSRHSMRRKWESGSPSLRFSCPAYRNCNRFVSLNESNASWLHTPWLTVAKFTCWYIQWSRSFFDWY